MQASSPFLTRQRPLLEQGSGGWVRSPGGVFTLVKNLSFQSAPLHTTWGTPWIRFPAEHTDAQLVVIVKGQLAGSSLTVQPVASWDTDSSSTVGAGATVTVPGEYVANLTQDLGPYVRVIFVAGAGTCQMLITVYLTPKRG